MMPLQTTSLDQLVFLVNAEGALVAEDAETTEGEAEEGHEGGHHENGFFLPGDIKEFWWGTAAFLVLMALVVWKGAGPIKSAMAARTERIENELNEAKEAKQKAEAALSESSADLPDLAQEEARIRREAKETATKLKSDLIAKAKAEAEALLERGDADIANRERQAQAELAAFVSDSTRRSAEAVVRETMDDQIQVDLIEKYINEVGQLS